MPKQQTTGLKKTASSDGFGTLIVSHSEITSILRRHVIERAYIKGLDKYIFTYALPRLISESKNGDRIYNNYENCIKNLLERTRFCFHHYEDKIYFGDRLTRRGCTSLLAYRYWRSLPENEQQKRSQYILVEKRASIPEFFDVSQMYSAEHLGEDPNDENYDEYNTVNYIEISQLRGQPASLQHNPTQQLTIEDTVQACIDQILADDPGLKMDNEEAALRMKPFIDARLMKKIVRNDKRLDTILSKIGPSSILKRLKEGLNKGYPKPNKDNPVRLSVPEFYLRYLDLFINKVLPPDWQRLILESPQPTQKAILKCAILINDARRIPFKKFSENGHLAPFPFAESLFLSQVIKHTEKSCELSDPEIAQILKPAYSAIKRLPGISEKDIEMLCDLSAKRLVNLLEVRKLGQYLASNLLNELRSDVLAKLYLNAIDSGVRHARLRNLVKAVYRHLCDSPNPHHSDHHDNAARKSIRAAHDLLDNHEKHLYAFFENWNKHPKYAPIINHVVDLLTSEIGGAQGDHRLAFRSLHTGGLPNLCGKEEIILSQSPIKQHNMQAIINIAKQDPEAVLKCNKLLQELPESVVSRNQLHVYAGNSVGSTKFYTYLSRLPNKRVENENRFKPLLPAMTKAIQHNFCGMTLWLLPSEDVLGSLGASMQGVCIPFGGDHHLEQQNKAVANLILCDSHQVYLWGLLVRVQNKTYPTYILNNTQGSLPSRYAKYKTEIRRHIRQILRELGDVYSLDFYFNAIQLLDEEDGKIDITELSLIVPNIRLDISKKAVLQEDFDHPNFDKFCMVIQRDPEQCYKKVS